jgi:hypothetical protein
MPNMLPAQRPNPDALLAMVVIAILAAVLMFTAATIGRLMNPRPSADFTLCPLCEKSP